MAQRPLPPLCPEARAVLRLQRTLSRRHLLAGAGPLGLGAILAGRGTGDSSSKSSDVRPTPAVDSSDTDKAVNWANWTLYLDYDDKIETYPTLDAFSKQTGIKASYAEDIEDNDSDHGKIQGQLKNGQDIGKGSVEDGDDGVPAQAALPRRRLPGA